MSGGSWLRRHGGARRRRGMSGERGDVVDPDVELAVAAQRRELGERPLQVLGVIGAGGVVGAEARYAVGLILPAGGGAWPWATLVVNTVGSVLIGVLMVVIVELVEAHRLVRPFLGVGVLGGFTTFSTYAVDALSLTAAARPGAAVGYVLVTPALAVLGCAAGAALTRVVAGRSSEGVR